MADAALAVTQEGGLFYLPEDTTTQHKDSTVQKRTFFKKFLDYFNDANKDKNHKKFDFSIIGGPHYSTDTKLGLGLVAAGRLADLRRAGPFLVVFAVVAPVCAGLLGIVTASLLGFSVGNAVLLATLYASASYIAAPAAMRIAVPEANPALSIGASLGITFPFNLIAGIPLYHWLAFRLNGVLT